ncbi:SH3 domain-containing protein [Tessaracoccus flavus]|uniref:Uncharacterized protein n=1 Tax=Tessaracoccus flavus TaxID=1610493 RepID=A0A1Q2CCH9_9ACTN|nr:SH3 domain-containing protein [Tessaracoccus flavus]AQP43822.1 hypothetical protein RPIT_02480 [Tessaracoccus flavus]SDY25061.1 Uncharacterized conserved protein YgiM, contains N-terminal SH3 domain, DUF1202 family [Tessaracoccus flavus]
MKTALRSLRGLAVATAAAILIQGLGSIALGPAADARDGDVTATARVHVRSGPSTSSQSLTVLDKGDVLPALGSEGSWTKVTFEGRTAYVFSAYLTGASSAPSSETSNGTSTGTAGTVATTANLNLRVGPSIRDRVSVVAPTGTRLTLTGSVSGEYAQVTYAGQTLWASTRYLSDPAANSGSTPQVVGKGRALANLLIRTSSDTAYSVITTVPRDTILEMTGVQANGMTQVVFRGVARWVNGSYFAPFGGAAVAPQPQPPATPETSDRYATTVLNIWTASTGTAYIRDIPRGTVVKVTGVVENGRAAIVDDGAIRWVTARYLSTTPPSSGASGGADDSLNRGGSSGLDKTNDNVKAIALDIWERYPQITTMYGWRRDVTPDHPAGRAVDVMIPSYGRNQALGWEIANYYRDNAEQYNINYIIFAQRIWSVARDKEGWRWMANRGSDNANHYNHVHINTYG